MKVTIIDSATQITATYTAPPQIQGDNTIYVVMAPGTVPPIEVPPVVVPPLPPVSADIIVSNFEHPHKGQPFTITPAQIQCYPVPQAPSGMIQAVQAPDTAETTQVEMWFSTVPGDVNDPLRLQEQTNSYGAKGYPCVKSYGREGGPLYWSTTVGGISTALLTPGHAYYVNYRFYGTTPPTGTTMGAQWD